jgi:transcriptional regulator with PAS, ATPase and Fis domain
MASSIKPVIIEGEVAGMVICLFYYNDIAKSAYAITNSDKIITFEDTIYQSNKMKKIVDTCKSIAQSSSTVLITGESGTGKEMFARAIHSSSNRSHNTFVAINCGAIPETLIESELFGYESGSFTGANANGKLGKFEIADKGTIFLDEISTMPLYLQSKLLRVIQERQIDKVGGTEPKAVDVRIIAATNENLVDLIAKGKFRKDLFYRLNVIPIRIPPLRERKEDIISLSYYFLNKYNKILNKHIPFIKDSFKIMLTNYEWPGNIRELENTIEYLINIAPPTEKYIDADWIPDHLLNSIKKQVNTNLFSVSTANPIPKKAYEYQAIHMLLSAYGHSTKAKKKIAQELGISLSTLYRKISSMENNVPL